MIRDLPVGSYTLVETQAPDGYTIIDDGSITVVIKKNEITEATIRNALLSTTGNLEITKIESGTSGSEAVYLSGAVFKLLDSEGNMIKENITTGSGGKTVVADLPAGAYTLIETQAPRGYYLDGRTETVITIVNGETEEVIIPNSKIKTRNSSSSDTSINSDALINSDDSRLSTAAMTKLSETSKEFFKAFFAKLIFKMINLNI